MRIRMDQTDQSQVFVATRDVRNSDHSNGTIEAGQRVYFSRDRFANGRRRVVLCSEDGQPTNGNQYLEFPSLHAAADFALYVHLQPTR